MFDDVDAGTLTIAGGIQLKFIAAPDFENPTDVGGNNIYEVQVRPTTTTA